MELLMMFGVFITVGILLTATVGYFYTQKLDEKGVDIAKGILISVENELFVASKVTPGYKREFSIPKTIYNKNYTLTLSGGDIILIYNDIDFIGTAPNATGSFVIGVNTVRNVNGRVCVNLVTC